MQTTKLQKTAILISSSLNTSDILEVTLENNTKYFQELGIDVFIGINGSKEKQILGLEVIGTSKISTWNRELYDQVNIIMEKGFESIILLLDDFYFFDIFSENINTIIVQFHQYKIDYLAFDKERFSLSHSHNKSINKYFKIRNKNLPYYSSLKISLWNTNYLIQCLSQKLENIWDFEHLTIGNHFTSKLPLIRYDHIVEKGKYRRILFKSIDEKSIKKINNSDRQYLIESRFYIAMKRIKFYIFGYSKIKF